MAVEAREGGHEQREVHGGETQIQGRREGGGHGRGEGERREGRREGRREEGGTRERREREAEGGENPNERVTRWRQKTERRKG